MSYSIAFAYKKQHFYYEGQDATGEGNLQPTALRCWRVNLMSYQGTLLIASGWGTPDYLVYKLRVNQGMYHITYNHIQQRIFYAKIKKKERNCMSNIQSLELFNKSTTFCLHIRQLGTDLRYS